MALFDASTPDAALVAEALRDNPEAFERLVLRYQRQVHAVARAIGVPSGSVEDVVQESFLQALAGLRALRSPAAFGPWLLAIARNLSRKEVTSRERPPALAPEEPAALEPRETSREEVREALWREVARLPEGVREAIFLYYHEGESVRQVAKALGISRTAAKSRLQRGRDHLRERLWRELEDGFREMVPAASEWRRRARRLTLLLVTAAATGGPSIPAEGSAQVAHPASVGVPHFLLPGALVMSAKKVLVGAALASLLLAASIGAVKFASVPRGGGETTAVVRPPAPVADSGDREKEEVAAVSRPAVTGIAGSVVIRETSAPVAGARVAAILEGERRHAAVVETGADGAYLLAGLRPGKYRLTAWREDWAARRSGDPRVEVREGELIGDQDLALVPGVVIEGRVVEEGTGMPLDGADVSFDRLQFAASDAGGQFRLEAIPDGLVTIAAHAPGHARRSIEIDAAHGEKPFVTIELPRGGVIEGTVSEPGGRPAAEVEVIAWGPSGGGSARADKDGRYRIDGILLTVTGDMVVTASRGGRFAARAGFPGFPPGESRITLDLRLAQGYLLRGRVVDPAGRPLAGARIELMGSSVFEDLRADDEGRFSIDGAGDNMYTLRARKEGRAPASVDLRQLAPGLREEIEVVLEEGHAVEGTVADAQEAPLAGAFVYLEDGAGMTHTAETDSRGKFRVADLPADLREIRADKGGYAMVRSEEVKAGQRDVRLVLDEAAKIEGIAIDAVTGEPVHPLLVKISGTEGESRERNKRNGSRGMLLSSFTRVGLPFDFADGGFKIRHGLAPGYFYRILVIAPGYREAIVDPIEAWPKSQAREPVRVEMEKGATLRGRVVAAATGEPVEGVKMSHVAEDRRRQRGYWRDFLRGERTSVRVALTDSGGSFEIDGLQATPGVILIEKPGFARTAIEGVVPGPDAGTFELEAAAILEVTVRDAAGEPLPEVTVTVLVDGQEFPRADTDARGSCRIDGLPGGTARVETRLEGHLGMVREAPLVPGQTAAVDFTRAGGAILGRVTDGGKPISGAGIQVKSLRNPDDTFQTGTDAQGTFRAGGLEPGAYEVRASRPNAGFFEGVSRTLEVGNGEARCEIELGPAAALSGRVVDRVSGEPVPGAHVMVYRHDPGFFGGAMALFFAGSDWAPLKGCDVQGEEARFHLEISGPGKYVFHASSGAGKGLLGWLGPVDIDPAGGTRDLEVRVGGAAALSLAIREAGTGNPVEGAVVVLRPAERYPFGIGGRSDAAGAAVIAGVPPGKYRLEAQGTDHLPAFVDLEVGEAPLEREIALERASWIAIEIGGAANRSRIYNVKAALVAGGDPGWTFSTAEGQPLTMGSTRDAEGHKVRLKTRAGRYTVRFDVMSPYITSPSILARELEVEVPVGGEATVLLALPEG